ncbi:ceroid-lipofuscinosis neuronal protein 5-like [Elysia marginata]|uniref:Bis(monoacylglycero)phosphate synthase CLN5 n=1 Tax=Elysia marginata TaxID=1093978 RepID=A0AAV4I127_9GAST|nr:ceroid-lipofuscinosis neuronal protein 5-like [Elysia marginata]
MHELGAEFDQSVHLNYTKVVLYSQQPTLLGNSSTIYNDSKTLDTLVSFYNYFQHRSMADIALHLLEYLAWFELHKTFYIFYNEQYWQLDMVKPYFQLTYDEVPLPSSAR